MICTGMNYHITQGTNVHLTSSARMGMVLIILSFFAIFVITTFLPKYIIDHIAYADVSTPLFSFAGSGVTGFFMRMFLSLPVPAILRGGFLLSHL
jgi:hypothetical protein